MTQITANAPRQPPNVAIDLRKQIDTLTAQAQGCVFAIHDLLDTDPQSPLTLRRLKAKATDLHRLLILIQLKNHHAGQRQNNHTSLGTNPPLAYAKRGIAQPYCRPTRSLNEPR